MESVTVELRYLPQVRWAALREVRGCDQLLVRSGDTAAAIRLLDSLFVAAPAPALQPGMAARLTAADRDRLLAAVHRSTFGPRVSGALVCTSCNQGFTLDFDLAVLEATMPAQVTEQRSEMGGHFVYQLEDGRLIRLPTGEDELAVARMAPDAAISELLRRCVVEGEWSTAPEAVQLALQTCGPLLDMALDAQCPECGSANLFNFNLQHFVLSAIAAEELQLYEDVHRIARAYGWALAAILELPRSSRRAFVALIEREGSRMNQRSYAL